ncbi:glycosyltransferase [Aeromonas caviae]|uniref:glycosyltransferase n=1 Tax=Aeromonas caviae TaxID=648 RepID=UPI00191EEE88|nr:glycosyltransferase [Aeromonas caviae]MBL0500225.1 glycosyltransferase [Aeromonas caviae]
MIELTIVTVNFNSGGGLKLTVDSLSDFIADPKVEFILIDACSTDESSVFINQRKNIFDVLVIEPDKGIYDAMNKAIKRASGKWIWFVNSGDIVLAACKPLLTFLALSEIKSTVVYSDLVLPNDNVVKQKCNKLFFIRRMMNHQNIIYSSDLLVGGYDLSFKYCADFAHMVRSLKKTSFNKYSEKLCMYDLDGFSSNRSYRTRRIIWKERYRAMRNSDSFFINCFGAAFAFFVFNFFWLLNLVKGA